MWYSRGPDIAYHADASAAPGWHVVTVSAAMSAVPVNIAIVKMFLMTLSTRANLPPAFRHFVGADFLLGSRIGVTVLVRL